MMMMLQLALLIDSCKLAIKSLKKWMKPEQVFFSCNLSLFLLLNLEYFGVCVVFQLGLDVTR
jgi:hypothetical protein